MVLPAHWRLRVRLRRGFRLSSMALLFLVYLVLWREESTASSRRLEEGSCPSPADPRPLVVGYIAGVLWLFIGLAIVADELFVPSLDLIAEKWGLSEDVAGATLMAAGGSSPELFTSAVGTFLRSSVGFGAIVGSAVFNVLFVVGVCALSTAKPMQLTWWPMFRDSTYYLVTLLVLAVFFGVNSPQEIDWYEALILHGMYWLYVFIMSQNTELRAMVERFLFCGSYQSTSLAAKEESLFNNPTKFRAGIASLLMRNRPFTETAGVSMVMALNGRVEEVFSRFDIDKSGTLDADEIRNVLSGLNLPSSQVTLAHIVSIKSS